MLPAQKSANLCWGQRYIWLRHHQLPAEHRNEAHIICRFDLPDGASVAGLRAVLNYLVRRHEALRTTYHLSETSPTQRVHPPGPLPLTVVTTERDGAASPAEVIEQLSVTDFELATEWPVRACVVVADGRPRQLVLVLNHMAFDAWAVEMFERELQVLGAGVAKGRPAVLEPVRHQPVDLARHEASAPALAAKDAALARWRVRIEELPADIFSGRRQPGGSAACSATLTSPALLGATRQIAQQHRVWPYLVHLAAYSMVLAAYTGGPATYMSFNGNRDCAEYANVRTCKFSPLLMHVDCSDNPPFAEVLRRAGQRFELGKNDSDVPYDELVELVSAESFRRGQALRVGSELNFLSHASRSSGARRTRFTWNAAPAGWAAYGSDTYFRIYELRDAVVLGLSAASTVLDAGGVERFLRGYEATLLTYAESATELRLDEVAELAGFDWAPARDGSFGPAATTDLGAVEAVLLSHPAVARVRLSMEPSGRLVAEVGCAHPVSAAQLRTHLLERLYDHAGLRCPDWFQLCGPAAAGASGDGLTGGQLAAASAAEQALAAAVRQVNELDELDLSSSYTVAGGRVLRIPRVLADLRERGWAGVSLNQLAGAQPLRAVARCLTAAA